MDSSALIEIAACISAASLHFAVGAVITFSAVLIPQLESPESEIKVTKRDISWIASVVPLITPMGALITGCVVDKIGRLNTIKASVLPYMLGWLCIAMAQDLSMLLVGRLLTGFSLALASNPAVVYITEVARPNFRGSLICMATSLASLGMVVIYAKGTFLHWRTIAWCSTAYCLLPVLFMSLWSPESPTWLISKGRTQDALVSLNYLHRKNVKAGLAEQQLSDLVKDHNDKSRKVNNEGSSTGNLLRALTKPNTLKPLFLLTAIFLFQQFSGIYVTIYYTVSFFKNVGAVMDPYVCSVGIGVVRLVMGLVTSCLLTNFGRRPLFITSGIGMAIFMFISGYYTKEITEGRMEQNLVPAVSILMYMSLGVIGFMSIPWTMTAELFATEVRGISQGLMIAGANVMLFAVLKIYPFLDDMLGGAYAVQWLFAGVSLIAALFIFIFLPETHDKKLSEIQDYFANHTVYILSKRKPTEEEITEENGEEMIKLKDTV